MTAAHETINWAVSLEFPQSNASAAMAGAGLDNIAASRCEHMLDWYASDWSQACREMGVIERRVCPF